MAGRSEVPLPLLTPDNGGQPGQRDLLTGTAFQADPTHRGAFFVYNFPLTQVVLSAALRTGTQAVSEAQGYRLP